MNKVKILVLGNIIASKDISWISGTTIEAYSTIKPKDADVVIYGDMKVEALNNLSEHVEFHASKDVIVYGNG